MKAWTTCGIILLAFVMICSLSYGEFSSSRASSGSENPEIKASLLGFSKHFLEVSAAEGFFYKISMEEAYDWQDEFVDLLKPTLGEVVGYKAGGFDRSGGGSGPPMKMRGTFLEKMLLKSGARVSSNSYVSSFIESDLILRVGSEAINTAETDDEILSALDAVIPLIEFPDMMIDTKGAPEDLVATTMIMANMVTRIAVLGDPIPLTASKDCRERLDSFRIVMTDQDGRELGSGSVAAKYAPLEVVRWLRDSLREDGKVLKKGHLLSLGNLGVVVPLAGGATGASDASGVFTGSSVKLTYLGLAPEGPAEVIVKFD